MDRNGEPQRWRILDQVEASGHGVYEDAVGVSGDLAWVIDGATPLTDERLTDAASDARWIVDRIDGCLRSIAPADPRPLAALVDELVHRIAADAPSWPGVPPSAALGVVRRRARELEYLVLADVTIAVTGSAPLTVTDRSVDAANGDAIAAFEIALRETRSFEVSIDRVRDLLVAQRRERMNRDGGYWVVADAPEAAHRAITGAMPIDDVERVLLCTDGFARLVDVFELYTSWEAFLASRTGLEEAVSRLRAAEAADGECTDHPRWSVSDDAAALLIEPA